MRAPHLYEQFEDLDKQRQAVRLGVWLFLASELLLFAGLFALYAAYRAMYPSDFEVAVAHNSVAIGTTNTVILITSSFTVATGHGAVEAGRPKRAALLLAVSVAFGLAFLVLKGIEYAGHFHEGFYPAAAYHNAELPQAGAKMFFTLYFYMTGLHAIHVTLGMCFLAWLAMGCLKERYNNTNDTAVEVGALYWHLVDVIWIFLWPMLYLMHR